MTHRPRDVDSMSLKILRLLLDDTRISYRDIGAQLGVAASTVGRHIGQMLEDGTISRFTCELNEERLHEGTLVFAKIKLKDHSSPVTNDFLKRISVFPEILEVYSIADSGDYLIKLLAPSNADYGAFVDEIIRKLLGFEHIDSTIILNQLLKRDPEPRLAFPFRQDTVADEASEASSPERKREQKA